MKSRALWKVTCEIQGLFARPTELILPGAYGNHLDVRGGTPWNVLQRLGPWCSQACIGGQRAGVWQEWPKLCLRYHSPQSSRWWSPVAMQSSSFPSFLVRTILQQGEKRKLRGENATVSTCTIKMNFFRVFSLLKFWTLYSHEKPNFWSYPEFNLYLPTPLLWIYIYIYATWKNEWIQQNHKIQGCVSVFYPKDEIKTISAIYSSFRNIKYLRIKLSTSLYDFYMKTTTHAERNESPA